MEIIDSEIPELLHDRMCSLVIEFDKVDNEIRKLNLQTSNEFKDFQDVMYDISIR